MTWKDEIVKNKRTTFTNTTQDARKRYEIAYKNLESEARDFLLLLKDVMNSDYDNNSIMDASSFMKRFERAYANMEQALNKIEEGRV